MGTVETTVLLSVEQLSQLLRACVPELERQAFATAHRSAEEQQWQKSTAYIFQLKANLRY